MILRELSEFEELNLEEWTAGEPDFRVRTGFGPERAQELALYRVSCLHDHEITIVVPEGEAQNSAAFVVDGHWDDLKIRDEYVRQMNTDRSEA